MSNYPRDTSGLGFQLKDLASRLFALERRLLRPPEIEWIGVGTGGTAPAFTNGWGNFGSVYNNVGFAKVDGVVYLRGLLSLGTPNVSAFTLPVGYRPAGRDIYAVHANPITGPASTGTAHTHTLSNTAGRCDILQDGSVILTASSGAWQVGSGVSVANVRFLAEN